VEERWSRGGGGGGSMRRTSYEDILQKLDYALAFGASIGLERIAQRGRFADYRRRIAHLIEVRGMRPFPQDVVAHLAEYLTALTESMELGDPSHTFSSVIALVLVQSSESAYRVPSCQVPSRTNRGISSLNSFLPARSGEQTFRHF
jgi:hypothetical protein